MGLLSLVASFFPKAKSIDKATIDTDHPASRNWRVEYDIDVDDRMPVSPTRPRGATLPSAKSGNLGIAIAKGGIDMGRSAKRHDGTHLPTLPLSLFTLIAAACRDRAVIDDLCSCGILQFCVDRFVLETDEPSVDVKVLRCGLCVYSGWWVAVLMSQVLVIAVYQSCCCAVGCCRLMCCRCKVNWRCFSRASAAAACPDSAQLTT